MNLTRRQWLLSLVAGVIGPSLPLVWRFAPSIPAPSLDAVQQAMHVYHLIDLSNQGARIRKVATWAEIETYTGRWRPVIVAGTIVVSQEEPGWTDADVWTMKRSWALEAQHAIISDYCRQGVWEEGDQRIPFRAIRLLKT